MAKLERTMLSIFYSSQNYHKAKFFIAVSLRTLITSTRWSQGHTEVWVEWGLRGWGNTENWMTRF